MTLCWCGVQKLERLELPNRRGGENLEFVVGNTRFTASVRRASKRARVTEIFVNGPKVDSDVDVTIRDAAVVISIALQYGISASELANSTGRNPDASAASPIGAILDILAREER